MFKKNKKKEKVKEVIETKKENEVKNEEIEKLEESEIIYGIVAGDEDEKTR